MRRLSFTLAIVFLVAPLFATNAIPTVNQPLVPSSVRPGRASFTLKVNGSAFVPGSVVNWNGVSLPTKFVSRSQLKAAVSSALVAGAGTVNVTVTNPAPGGGTSSPVFFTVTVPTASLTFATSVINVGLTPAALVEGDFNNDGNADLAVVNLNQLDSCYPGYGLGTIQILLGNGSGGFNTASSTCFPVIYPPAGPLGLPFLMAADFNGDGKLDVAGEWYFAGYGNAYLEIYLGNGDGTLTDTGSRTFLTDGDVTTIPAFSG